ncbi:endonuclease/exonuclease/phosphatase family protein [Rhodococcus xishaensis]|uniref:Endonuclease/exonuclease/phosphatase family protein n=1 Tax=Rhodococcus xishaensis TaxID=2487364 RepID=A0A3S3ABP9_9NOCA|nr:endonuclease/exonuclease/phosphatase family protein [Rhodococcus xishaensis]RVW00730.1 endonuclease/exonuclease/phosphatase family protein [Rhodococcus xishaensis]
MIDHRTARNMARVFAAACGALGAAGLVASMIAVDRRIPVLLAAMTPTLLVIALGGAVVAAVAREWAVQAACLTVCAVGAAVLAPLYIPGASGIDPADATGPTVRLMQANIKVGQADPVNLVETVRDREVDILTVQEITDESAEALRAAGLGELLPHQFVVSDSPDGLGGAIYSRFPLSNTRHLAGYLSANLTADVDVGLEEPLALVAVHPAPAFLFPAKMWAEELRGVRDEMAANTLRDNVVVSGDFNASYPQRQYRDLLANGYADAADQVGAGLVPTMPANRWFPAVTGIDRIITKGAVATSLDRIEIVGSDHHGLVADIRLRGPGDPTAVAPPGDRAAAQPNRPEM